MKKIINAGIETIAAILQEQEDFLLTGHTNPDGDSIGSMLGLGMALRALGKKRVRLRTDTFPPVYSFLPGAPLIEVWGEDEPTPAVFVALDCATPERFSGGKECFAGAAITINLDHHFSNSYFAGYNCVDPAAAAVGEQVFLLLEKMLLKPDRDVATCLYTAIITDSGSFRYDNTTPRTHRAAAELLEYGADSGTVNTTLFETRSREQTKLLALVLGTLTVSPGGKVAWLTATRDMLRVTGVEDIETEALIGFARAVSGVEVAILFREQTDGTVRVGLRSRQQFDVNTLARQFGGGGHPKAAGCTMPGAVAAVRDLVVNAARKAVND